jgi:MFS family permease
MMSSKISLPHTSESLRLRLALLIIVTAQLMLVLDDTIVNIALPSIQREFTISSSILPWVVNAYILAFCSLQPFGGRVGDLYGRRRVFKAGLILFTAASFLGGFGPNVESLIAARSPPGYRGSAGCTERPGDDCDKLCCWKSA